MAFSVMVKTACPLEFVVDVPTALPVVLSISVTVILDMGDPPVVVMVAVSFTVSGSVVKSTVGVDSDISAGVHVPLTWI